MYTTRINRTVAWGLLAGALLASAASFLFGLYEKHWWYDEALHGYFTFALTLVLALHAYGALLTGRHEALLVLTLAGLGLALSALWEMVEWAYDQMMNNDVILGKRDTIYDYGRNGSLAVGYMSLRMLRK